MIKEFLKYANLGGSNESFIVNKNSIAVKTEDGSIGCFVESKKDLFKTDFALTESSSLIKVLDSFDPECEEDDNKLIFKSSKKSKLTWLKADIRILQPMEKTRDSILGIYSSDKLELELNKEEIIGIIKVLKSGIDSKIKFYNNEGNLNILVGQDFRYTYETVIKENCLTKRLNNCYSVSSLVKVFDTVSSKCKIILDCDYTPEGEIKSFPLVVIINDENIDVTYFVAPIKES